MTEKKLTEKELKQASGSLTDTDSEGIYFEVVTVILKEAGDRAYDKLGPDPGVWYYTNQAEKATTAEIRKQNIQSALLALEVNKRLLYPEDYNFIKEKLDLSNELTNR